MRTVAAGTVMGLIVVAAALATTRDARAQPPERPPAVAAPFLMLQGPGSSIGVRVRDLAGDEAAKTDAGRPAGVVIEEVTDGSPAARAGFRKGDMVVEFDGERVRGVTQFTRLVRETPPSRAVQAVVVRDGTRQSLTVTPEAGRALQSNLGRDIESRIRSALPRDFAFDFEPPVRGGRVIIGGTRLGATVSSMDDQLAEYFGAKAGVLVSRVEAGSLAASAGLRAGDVITAINGRTIATAADVTSSVRAAQPGSTLEISVVREKRPVVLTVPVPERERPVTTRRLQV